MLDPSRTTFLAVSKKGKWLFLVRRIHIPCKAREGPWTVRFFSIGGQPSTMPRPTAPMNATLPGLVLRQVSKDSAAR